MKRYATVASIVLAVFNSYGAEPSKPADPYSCDSQEMLQSVAQVIKNTNNLAQDFGYDFDQIKTKYSSKGANKLLLKCEARLKLFDLTTNNAVDTLMISYQVKSGKSKNDLVISFEPMR